MLKGKILAGEERLSAQGHEARWKNDFFTELHKDDALWAFMICSSEELKVMNGRLQDPVMRRLLQMGIYDWTGVR